MLVHRYYYNVRDLPDGIAALFAKVSSIHLHRTRAIDNLSLFINFGRLNVRKNSVKIYAPTVWNEIPTHIKQIVSTTLFKKVYKKCLSALVTVG